MARLLEEYFEAFDQVGHEIVGADPAVQIDIGVRADLTGEVGDRQLRAAASDGHGQHHAGVGVETQQRRGTTARGGAVRLFGDQSTRGERRDPGPHGGPRQSRDRPHLGPGGHNSVTDEAEDLARGGG